MIIFISVAIFAVLFMPYYFFRKEKFNNLLESLMLTYGKNIVDSLKKLYFINDLVFISLISPIITSFFQIFSKDFSVSLVYEKNTLGVILRQNLITIIFAILGIFLFIYINGKVSKAIDEESLDNEKKQDLKDYLSIKRYYFFLGIGLILIVSILLSYIRMS